MFWVAHGEFGPIAHQSNPKLSKYNLLEALETCDEGAKRRWKNLFWANNTDEGELIKVLEI